MIMKWVGISGTWRKTASKIEKRVRKEVKKIMKKGEGIVSGGALGVDFFALDEALKWDKKAERIKIFLPTTLKRYSQHLRKHARWGDVEKKDVEKLISKLKILKKLNPKALFENPNENFTEKTKKRMYYTRNTRVVNASDKLIAFDVETKEGKDLGTLDTIKKAEKKGIPIKVFEFKL